MKRRIRAGFILLALLTFCALAHYQTAWASDMEAQTEVRLYIEENEKTAVSDSNDVGKDEKAEHAGVQTGDSENILLWSSMTGTVLLVGISVLLIRKKLTEAST